MPQSHVSRLLAKYHRRSVSLLQMADPVVGLLTEDADGQFRRWRINVQRQRRVSLVVLGEIYMSVRALSLYVLQNRHHLIMSLSLPFFICSTGIIYNTARLSIVSSRMVSDSASIGGVSCPASVASPTAPGRDPLPALFPCPGAPTAKAPRTKFEQRLQQGPQHSTVRHAAAVPPPPLVPRGADTARTTPTLSPGELLSHPPADDHGPPCHGTPGELLEPSVASPAAPAGARL